MIAQMPFPMTDLAEGRGDGTCEKIQSNSQDQDGKLSIQPCRSMEFKPLGQAPGGPPEPDRLYTEDDLARAVDDARRTAVLETETEVRSAMANDTEKRRSDMLASIKDQLEQHRSVFEEELTRLATVSFQLAIALAEAVIPRAIERQPLADITDLLKATITGLAAAPAIELRLHPSQIEDGKVLMADLVRDAGFAGEVMTVPDPVLGEGDAELRWKSGAVSRRISDLQAEALDLAGRWLHDLPESKSGEASRSLSTPLEPAIPNAVSDEVSDGGFTNEGIRQ